MRRSSSAMRHWCSITRRSASIGPCRPTADRAGEVPAAGTPSLDRAGAFESIEKIDLGEIWTRTTGLPFVYAFWAGRPDALAADQVGAIQAARDAGVADLDRVAAAVLRRSGASGRSGATYLRDNIKYHFGEQERAGLETFYRYAAELGLVPEPAGLRFYDAGVDSTSGTDPIDAGRLHLGSGMNMTIDQIADKVRAGERVSAARGPGAVSRGLDAAAWPAGGRRARTQARRTAS